MSKSFKTHTMRFGLMSLALGGLLLIVVFALSATTPVAAAPRQQGEKPSNESCLACHQQEGMSTQIGGQPLALTIDPGKFTASVHGMENFACVDCHTDITGFPHPAVAASSTRDFSLKMY